MKRVLDIVSAVAQAALFYGFLIVFFGLIALGLAMHLLGAY